MIRTAILSAALTLSIAAHAEACSPASQPTKQQLFDAATSVFTAHVVDVSEVDAKSLPGFSPSPVMDSMHLLRVKFRVLEKLKGDPSNEEAVFSLAYGPGNCTIPMMAGWDYLFFDNAKANHLITSLDGSTPFLNIQAEPVQALLNELRAFKK